MWDLPGPGIEPISSPLAGRLSTTASPGKPLLQYAFLGNPTDRGAWQALVREVTTELNMT